MYEQGGADRRSDELKGPAWAGAAREGKREREAGQGSGGEAEEVRGEIDSRSGPPDHRDDPEACREGDPRASTMGETLVALPRGEASEHADQTEDARRSTH